MEIRTCLPLFPLCRYSQRHVKRRSDRDLVRGPGRLTHSTRARGMCAICCQPVHFTQLPRPHASMTVPKDTGSLHPQYIVLTALPLRLSYFCCCPSGVTANHIETPIAFAHTIPYHTIPYHTVPYRTVPYRTVPYHTIPYHTIPYHTIPYHTIPYHTIPYHTIPFSRGPYRTVPYRTVPYHTIPYLCKGCGY